VSEVVLVKTTGGALAPADDGARAFIEKIKAGQGVSATVRKARNVRFHRKMFALFKLAFDAWEPMTPLEYKGLPVSKDFDRFRKDMTILAGFYKAVYNARGEVRLEAESLSFGSMDEERFNLVYRAVLSVIWDRVLRSVGYASKEQVDGVVEELLRFDQ